MTIDLLHTLRLHGPMQAGELTRRAGVSRATLMRAVQAAGEAVIVRGRARRTRYAARRALRGAMQALPLYRVDRTGQVREVTRIDLVHPGGCALGEVGDFGWPLDDGDMREGWFEGLPYPVLDMQPQGFLGRHFARQHAHLLQLAPDPRLWDDDGVLHALGLLGSDVPGDLIVGEPACRRWLEGVQRLRAGNADAAITEEQVARVYAERAAEALAAGDAGSSAGGEFPKFTALRQMANGREQAVLVKFSGDDDSPGSRRWADLLVCEHLAGEVLREELGVRCAVSRVWQHGGRTFLEVERFDRHGRLGRSGVVSWGALNAACVGVAGLPWGGVGERLVGRGWLAAEQAQTLAAVWHVGRLIGNTDMHDGNLSFEPARVGAQDGLTLAPVYDMLPMAYAPVRGVELPQRDVLSPALPLPGEQAAWARAARVAVEFWERVAADGRVGDEMRRRGEENGRVLRVAAGGAP